MSLSGPIGVTIERGLELYPALLGVREGNKGEPLENVLGTQWALYVPIRSSHWTLAVTVHGV